MADERAKVTVAMGLIGAMPWIKAALLITAQLLGGIAAAGAVSATFPGPLSVRTSLGDGTSISRGVFIEMFLTALLIFCIFMLAAEKHRGTFIAPVGIGLALFVAEMAGKWFLLIVYTCLLSKGFSIPGALSIQHGHLVLTSSLGASTATTGSTG